MNNNKLGIQLFLREREDRGRGVGGGGWAGSLSPPLQKKSFTAGTAERNKNRAGPSLNSIVIQM